MTTELMAELAIIKLIIELHEILWMILKRLQKMQNRYYEVDRTPLYNFICKNESNEIPFYRSFTFFIEIKNNRF